MIKLLVIGNLGKDAVLNNVNGKNVINFNVAHTERYKDAQGTQKDRTVWVDCSYWTDKTGVVPYLKKGTQVYVEGNPDVRTYTTQDGRNGATLTLRVLSIQLVGTRGNEGATTSQSSGNYDNASATPAPAYNNQPAVNSPNELTEPMDDLPF